MEQLAVQLAQANRERMRETRDLALRVAALERTVEQMRQALLAVPRPILSEED